MLSRLLVKECHSNWHESKAGGLEVNEGSRGIEGQKHSQPGLRETQLGKRKPQKPKPGSLLSSLLLSWSLGPSSLCMCQGWLVLGPLLGFLVLQLQVLSALSPLSKPKCEAGMPQPRKTPPLKVKVFPAEKVAVPSLGDQVVAQKEEPGWEGTERWGRRRWELDFICTWKAHLLLITHFNLDFSKRPFQIPTLFMKKTEV